MARNSARSSARVIGSSAPNGSSISSTGGSAASARAMPTRWRWPPESSSGQRSRNSPAAGPRAPAGHRYARAVRSAGHASSRGTIADVLAHGQMREQPDLLQHVARRAAGGRTDPMPARLRPLTRIVPACGSQQAVDQFEDGALARAAAADEGQRLARGNRERDILEDAPRRAGERDRAELDGRGGARTDSIRVRACSPPHFEVQPLPPIDLCADERPATTRSRAHWRMPNAEPCHHG